MEQSPQAELETGAPKVPKPIWAPVIGGLLVLFVGTLGLVSHRPWLFPSLGPTIYLQTADPKQKAARFDQALLGHLMSIAAGFLAVFLLQTQKEPSVLASHLLTAPRVWTAVLAIALTLLGDAALKVSHPPAAATTLLIALGAFQPKLDDLSVLLAGVIATVLAGEVLRAVRAQQRPFTIRAKE